jgi:hypothetical protein
MNLILSTENEAKLGNWFVISGRRQAAGGRRQAAGPTIFFSKHKKTCACVANKFSKNKSK